MGWKEFLGAAVGGTAGFLVGGPAGAVYGAAAGYSAGAASEAGDEAAKQAERNAKAEEEMARLRLAQQRAADARVMGIARARYGGSAVTMAGSPLLFMAEQAKQAELNALIVTRGGELAAEADRAQGRAAKSAYNRQAVGSLLESGFNLYSMRPSSSPSTVITSDQQSRPMNFVR